MEQFIRYLYEYRENKPEKNAGFVRIEPENQKTKVHIHGKGLQLGAEEELSLYLFYMGENAPIAIYQGTVTGACPALNYCFSYTAEEAGGEENYKRIAGLILETEDHRKFASGWDDMPIDLDKMMFPRAAVIPQSMTEVMTEAVLEEQQEEAAENENEECPVEYKRIRRQDIARLPRSEWRLANNSFLLHGYYNYNYLMLIYEEEKTLLGVPGCYHPREARAAMTFGFSEFITGEELKESTVGAKKDTLEDYGKEPESGTFGYWCRQIRGNRGC